MPDVLCAERIALAQAVGNSIIRIDSAERALEEAKSRGVALKPFVMAIESAQQVHGDAVAAFAKHRKIHGC